jgi:hypothetical protein
MNDEFWNRLFEIVVYDLRDGAIYKSLIFLNRSILAKAKLANHLWTLIKLYPDKWNWAAISMNPCTTMKLIELNLQMPWNYYAMSYNQNVI